MSQDSDRRPLDFSERYLQFEAEQRQIEEGKRHLVAAITAVERDFPSVSIVTYGYEEQEKGILIRFTSDIGRPKDDVQRDTDLRIRFSDSQDEMAVKIRTAVQFFLLKNKPMAWPAPPRKNSEIDPFSR